MPETNTTRESQNAVHLIRTKISNIGSAHYSTADSINTYRDRFFNTHQREGESFDDYFKRFREARGTLDTPLSETYIVYFFVRNLLTPYRGQIRGDRFFQLQEHY